MISFPFCHHVESVVAHALEVFGFIKCNTKFFTLLNCNRCFHFALVPSILKFDVTVQHLYFAKDPLRLDHVQNRFLSFVAFTTFIIDIPIHDYDQLHNLFNMYLLILHTAEFRVLLHAPELIIHLQLNVPSCTTHN